MPRPILDAIRQFRSNRQERVAERRENIRGMLGMSGSGKPRERMIPHLLRSLGAGTSRQDLFWSRKAVAKPPERAYQDNPAGPDTGKDANQRPYDGDGQKAQAASIKVNPVIADNGEPETIKAPAPVQGGSQSLPAPPQAQQPKAPASEKRRGPPAQPHDEGIKATLAQMQRMVDDPQTDPHLRYRIMQDMMLAQTAQNTAALDHRRTWDDSVEGTLANAEAMGQADPDTARLVFPTTNLAPKGPDGAVLKQRVPTELTHRKTFIDRTYKTVTQYQDWGSIPDPEKTDFLRHASAAFPVYEFLNADGTQNPSNLWSASRQATLRIYSELSNAFNSAGNPSLDMFLRNVAIGIIWNQGGQFVDSEAPEMEQFMQGAPIQRRQTWFGSPTSAVQSAPSPAQRPVPGEVPLGRAGE